MPSIAPEGSAKSVVPSIQRAVQVLDLLASRGRAMTLAAMARELSLPKSSLLAICTTLTRLRMMERTSDGRYELGLHLVDLGSAYVSGTDLVKAFTDASPQVPSLAEETLVLSVLDGANDVFLGRRLGAHPVGVVWYQVGSRMPANCTATGKAQLSALPDAALRQLFSDTPQRLTPHSIVDVDELTRDIDLTRRRGIAFDDEESRVGLVCVGCPVFDASSSVTGAVAVAIEKIRWLTLDHAAISEAVQELSQLMSRQLGHVASGLAQFTSSYRNDAAVL